VKRNVDTALSNLPGQDDVRRENRSEELPASDAPFARQRHGTSALLHAPRPASKSPRRHQAHHEPSLLKHARRLEAHDIPAEELSAMECNKKLRELASRSVYLTEHIVLNVTQMVRNLTQGEYCVLAFLESRTEDVTAVEIADRVCLTRPRITQIINTLEEYDFVERKKDAYDKRKTNIHITDKGRFAVKAQREDAIERHMRFYTWLGDDDAAELILLLEKSLGYFSEKNGRDSMM